MEPDKPAKPDKAHRPGRAGRSGGKRDSAGDPGGATTTTPTATPTSSAPATAPPATTTTPPATTTTPPATTTTPEPTGIGQPQNATRAGDRRAAKNRTSTGARGIGTASATSPATAVGGAAESGGERANQNKDSKDRGPSVVERIVNRIPPQLIAALCAMALLALSFALLSLRERRRYARARQDALIDPVTGIANRLAFERRMSLEWNRAKRYQRPLGVLLLDLDDFKRVNDTHGHAEGDRVLQEAATTLDARVRDTDFAARVGGDEFVVLCPETDADGLEYLAGSLRAEIKDLPVGASLGLAEHRPDDQSPAELMQRADTAMYNDKDRKHLAERRSLAA